jgi:predicted XRE-type DNA-binding protein
MSPDESIHALRRQLAREIVRSLGPNSHYVLAPAYGIPQPRMSELAHGKVDRCTVEWLIRRIHRMGGQVTIVVTLDDTARAWHLAHSKSGIQRRRPSTG